MSSNKCGVWTMYYLWPRLGTLIQIQTLQMKCYGMVWRYYKHLESGSLNEKRSFTTNNNRNAATTTTTTEKRKYWQTIYLFDGDSAMCLCMCVRRLQTPWHISSVYICDLCSTIAGCFSTSTLSIWSWHFIPFRYEQKKPKNPMTTASCIRFEYL